MKCDKLVKVAAVALSLSFVTSFVTGCGNKNSGSEYTGTVISQHDDNKTQAPSDKKEKKADNNKEKNQKILLRRVNRDHIDVVIAKSDKSIFKKGTNVLSFNYSELKLTGDSKSKYAALNKTLKSVNKSNIKTVNASFKQLKKASMNEFKIASKSKKSLKEYIASDYNEDLSVERADDKVLSFKTEISSYYTGANHPISQTVCNNISSVTGKKMKLTDVLKPEYSDYNSLSKVIVEKLRERYPKSSFYGDSDKKMIKNVKSIMEENNKSGNANWVINNEEILFYFDPYELDSYSAGRFNVSLSFVKDGKYISDEYIESSNNFTRLLSTNESTYVDLKQNGKYEKLKVKSTYSKYYEISKLIVEYNGNKKSVKVNGYKMESMLLHSRIFGDFVYIDLHQDNDYESIYIFKLTKNKVKYVGYIDSGFDKWFENNKEYVHYPTDTDNFTLSTRMYALSTYEASRNYTLTKSGKPKADTKYYELKETKKLTLKKNLKCDKINKNTDTVSKKVTLKKGRKVFIYRTDGKTYVDLSDKAKNNIFRVYIKDSKNGDLVNNQDIYKVFKGMAFAG